VALRTDADTSLATLVDELCEAHADTIAMATDADLGPEWDVHVAYLQALGRLAQATLARAEADVAA
jgi:hypothetical protein